MVFSGTGPYEAQSLTLPVMEPSLHLTVGLDVMINVDGGESIDLTNFHFVGANPRSGVAVRRAGAARR